MRQHDSGQRNQPVDARPAPSAPPTQWLDERPLSPLTQWALGTFAAKVRQLEPGLARRTRRTRRRR